MAFRRTKYGEGWEHDSVQSQKCSRECVNRHSMWIQCDTCDEWGHVTCIGLTKEKAYALPQYHCRQCRKIRKVSRVKESRPSTKQHVELERAERAESPMDPPREKPTGRQQCPCGKSRSMESRFKCLECYQEFYAACGKVNPPNFQFLCPDCESRDAQLRNELSKGKTFHSDRNDFSVYAERGTDRNRDELSLSIKPITAPRKSFLRKKDASEQRQMQRSTANPESETDTMLNGFRFADRGRMQIGRATFSEKQATPYERLTGKQPHFEMREPADGNVVGKRSNKENVADAEMRAGKVRVGFTGFNEQSQVRRYPSHLEAAKKSRVLSYRPSLKELEEVILDKHLKQTEKRMRELAYEIRELEARAESLRKERESSIAPYAVHAHTQMPEVENCCETPHHGSVVIGEPVVETQDGEICFLPTSENASAITIGKDQVAGTADPVKEISPNSKIIATEALEEVTAQFDPPTLMQNRKRFGPYRILESSRNINKALPVDKPLAKSQIVPLVRSWPIPVEIPRTSALSVTTGEINVTEVDKEVRPGAGQPLVPSPLTALAPPWCKVLSIFVPPPTTPQRPARQEAPFASDSSFGRAQLFIVPPPFDRTAAPKLLAASDQPHLRAVALGRRVIEYFVCLLDRRFVDRLSGKWPDPDRALLRQHLLEMSAVCSLNFCQRPCPWPPPLFRQQSARSASKSRRRSPPPTPG